MSERREGRKPGSLEEFLDSELRPLLQFEALQPVLGKLADEVVGLPPGTRVVTIFGDMLPSDREALKVLYRRYLETLIRERVNHLVKRPARSSAGRASGESRGSENAPRDSQIRALLKAGKSAVDLAGRYSLSRQAIYDIKNGRAKKKRGVK